MASNVVDDELEDVNFNEEKYRSVAVESHTISNVMEMEDGNWRSSQPFYVQGLKWDIGMKVGKEGLHTDSVFSVFLRYLGGAPTSRPVLDIEMKLVLVKQTQPQSNYKKDFHGLFDTSCQDRMGSAQFIFWTDILNPQRGYLKDDSITVQLYLAAAPPAQKIDLSCARSEPPTIISSSLFSDNSKSDDERLKSQVSRLTVSDRAQKLLDSEIGWDCEFLVKHGEDSKTFRASKVLLARVSEYFERKYFGEFDVESRTEVQDVKPAVFYQMLQYAYICNWSLESRENAKDLYYLADRYLMDELKITCLSKLWPKDVDSVWCAFELATHYHHYELKAAALKIICENTSDIFTSDNFLQLCHTRLITILEQNQLNITSEIQVFKAVHRWALAQCSTKGVPVNGPNLRLELGRVVQYIRFLTMTQKEFIGEPVESGILTDKEIIGFTRAFIDNEQYLPPSNMCPLRNPRKFILHEKPESFGQKKEFKFKPATNGFGFGGTVPLNSPLFGFSTFGNSQSRPGTFGYPG